VTLAALIVGAAAPARAQSQPAADATTPAAPASDEAPAVKVIHEMPPLTVPIPDPGAPPQQVRVMVHRARPGLIISGAAIFGASYAASLMVGLLVAGTSVDCEGCGDSHASDYVIPVAGPVIAWSRKPADRRGSPAPWVGWSALQAAGVAMLVVGIRGHDVPEWRPLDGGPRVTIVPTLTPSSGALSLDVSW
jgi:hypothetical protein